MRRNRVSVDQCLRGRNNIVDVDGRISLQQLDTTAHINFEKFFANIHQHCDSDELSRDRRSVRKTQNKIPQGQDVSDGKLQHKQNRNPPEGVEFRHDHEFFLEVFVQLGVAHFEQEREGSERLRETAVALVVGDRTEVVATPLHERLEAEEDVGLDCVHAGGVAVAGGPEEEADHLVHALGIGAAAVDAGEEEEHATQRQLRGREGHAAEGRFF